MGMVRLALALLLATALPAAAQETRIAALNFAPDDHPRGMALPALVRAVNSETRDLRIHVLPGGALAPFRIAGDLRNRQIDIASLAPHYYRAMMPMADVLELIERPVEELRRNGAFDQLDRLHGDAMNVKLLAIFGTGEHYYIYLRERRIDRLAYENVRLMAPPTAIALAKRMGALLMQMPMAEVSEALEKASIDGLIWPGWDVAPNGWMKRLKFKVEPGVNAAAWVLLINRASWNGLTAAHRDALSRAAEVVEAADAKLSVRRNADARRAEEQAGMQPIRLGEADASTLIQAAQEIGWDGLGRIDSDGTRRLRRLLVK